MTPQPIIPKDPEHKHKKYTCAKEGTHHSLYIISSLSLTPKKLTTWLKVNTANQAAPQANAVALSPAATKPNACLTLKNARGEKFDSKET
jgi:hypothetical protein